ncbi:MAG: hypothetical protein IPM46_06645 [Flavobacteriales bacterium]|nr:hypothetical protein [Flavobacteriales bacterium]MBK9176010.1 hypothetical protein [Flavobacteriales bacterium]
MTLRTSFLTYFLLCFCTWSVQAQVFDYVRIEQVNDEIVISSTTDPIRVVTWFIEKGEEGVLARSAAARSKAYFALVREFEEKGWEVYTVWKEPTETWIMRKPKQ